MDKRIAEWKRKHKSIFRFDWDGKDLYYRQLSAEEFFHIESLERKIDDTILEDIIIDLGVLNKDIIKEEHKKSMAYSNLATLIINSSTIKDEEFQSTIKNLREDQENNIFKRLIAGILTHIPSYTPEDLFKKNIDQLLEIAILAELVPVSTTLTEIPILNDPSTPKAKIPNTQHPTMPFSQKKWSMDQETLNNMANEDAHNALSNAMSKEGGVKTRPITEIKAEKSNTGAVADKMRQMNEFLEEKLPK